MPAITRLDIRLCRNIDELTIEIPPGEGGFRHLILTGPNGSGKSGILEGIRLELEGYGVVFLLGVKSSVTFNKINGHADNQRLGGRSLRTHVEDDEEAAWKSMPVACAWNTSIETILTLTRERALFATFSPAQRKLAPRTVEGPSRLPADILRWDPARRISEWWLQYLVNQKFEQLLSSAEPMGNAVSAQIGAWFASLEAQLRELLEDPTLTLEFDRKNYRFFLRRPDGYTFDFTTLADGHSAALTLLTELTLRKALMAEEQNNPAYEPDGIVIIDEIEAHLHLRLQEKILPFLTGLFPKLQFIVATHAPAVISSIPNAVVYDLGTRSSVLSDDLRGVRFGTLMTEHFGLKSDMDLDSTQRLVRLAELAGAPHRTAEQDTEMRLLADQLTERSHTLALEVWRRLHREREVA